MQRGHAERQLNVSVIGLGRMGSHHVRVWHDLPGVRLTAVVDHHTDRSRSVARTLGVPAYDSLDALLQHHHVDALSIATPPASHAAIALDALAHGIHVLIEKPCTTSVRDARRVLNAAELTGTIVRAGLIERFNPAVLALHHYLQQTAAPIREITVERRGPVPVHQSNVGVTLDLAIHDLDLASLLTAQPLHLVTATTRRDPVTGSEHALHAVLRSTDGVLIDLRAAWQPGPRVRQLVVRTDAVVLHADLLSQTLLCRSHDPHAVPVALDTAPIHAFPTPLHAQLSAFRDTIRGLPARIASGDDAVAALALAKAVLGAAHAGDERRPRYDSASEPALW